MLTLSYTAQVVLAGVTVLGVAAGVVGSLALLRRQSLLSDALAHAALPGVCLAFLLTHSKSSLPLLLGALVAGLLGALLVVAIVRLSRIKEDAAIGVVLSVFFALGIVLLTRIQKLPFGNQSGLDKFLFGQAATLMPRDVALIAALATLALLAVGVFYKELKLLCFDREFGQTQGLAMRRIELLLTLLLVTVVVVGLQAVGVVLMVAALITPAAAARQWTDRFGVMLLVAAALGGGVAAAGVVLSARVANAPTGPAIVVVSSAVLVVSLLFAPQRGLIWARLASRKVAGRIRRENLLKDLYLHAERRGAESLAPVPWRELMGIRGQSRKGIGGLARSLARQGLLTLDDRGLALSAAGFAEAEGVVRRHRLWEVYLTRRLELPSDHVHRDAEVMEHALSSEAVRDLEELLGWPEMDPHGRPIPRRRALA
ncbi:MAG TPA: iron chelate uptake ABC transporter family permease subunit [Thermoanaerobaculia bacterium]|nr:iron chelate uptake ABC transporter family permease subunit [Thermoanaerobaculia bacterium]